MLSKCVADPACRYAYEDKLIQLAAIVDSLGYLHWADDLAALSATPVRGVVVVMGESVGHVTETAKRLPDVPLLSDKDAAGLWFSQAEYFPWATGHLQRAGSRQLSSPSLSSVTGTMPRCWLCWASWRACRHRSRAA